MKKMIAAVLVLAICIALVACNSSAPSNNSGNSIQGDSSNSHSNSAESKQENKGDEKAKYAEKALRKLLEDQNPQGALQMHHPGGQFELTEIYVDVLEDFNLYGDYEFVSCKHIKTTTVSSGDTYDTINDGLSYYGYDTYASMIECTFSVTLTSNGKTWTETIPVYMIAEGNGYSILQIVVG